MSDLMLAHNVYFTLKDDSDEAVQNLVNDCYTYLKDADGVAFFGAGPRVADLAREVNVQDFHVGLHVIFNNKAAHDAYQTAENHLTFISRNKENWQQVRVLDNYLGC